MNTFVKTFSLASLLTFTALPVHAELDRASLVRLRALEQTPAAAGELIYQGDTYALVGSGEQPLFRYERRVIAAADGLTATHLTRNPQDQLIVVESAQVSPGYALQRFTTVNQQSDFSGSVEVSADARQLHYSLLEQGEASSADEAVDVPVISGPSMHGFILMHWDTLKAGSSLPVRFIVLREKQTYGFDIRFEQEAEGQTTFALTPSNWLIRLAIQPLRVVFDTSSKTVVRYEGRVPPMQEIDGELQDLDARVEYVAITPSYR